MSFDLAGSSMVGLTRDTLSRLRAVLFRDTGENAAAYLHEAGYAGGDALHDAFARWCRSHKLPPAETMSAPDFEAYATAFFSDMGWGALQVGTLHDSVLTLDSSNWAEADPSSGMQYPGCYLTTGMLSVFFGRVAESPIAVMEVECRSMGAERCRFLMGSAETIQYVYSAITQGHTYEAALATMV